MLAITSGMVNLLRRSWLLGVMVLLLLTPATARAGDEARVTPMWMVFVTDPAVAGGRNWGVLLVADGRLTFASNSGNLHWQADLADTWHVGPSKRISGALDIEMRGGQVFTVTVLNAQLTPQSPKSAIRTIVDAASAIKKEGRLAEASIDTPRPQAPAAATVPTATAASVTPGGGPIH